MRTGVRRLLGVSESSISLYAPYALYAPCARSSMDPIAEHEAHDHPGNGEDAQDSERHRARAKRSKWLDSRSAGGTLVKCTIGDTPRAVC